MSPCSPLHHFTLCVYLLRVPLFLLRVGRSVPYGSRIVCIFVSTELCALFLAFQYYCIIQCITRNLDFEFSFQGLRHISLLLTAAVAAPQLCCCAPPHKFKSSHTPYRSASSILLGHSRTLVNFWSLGAPPSTTIFLNHQPPPTPSLVCPFVVEFCSV